jgi:hypothetical protein
MEHKKDPRVDMFLTKFEHKVWDALKVELIANICLIAGRGSFCSLFHIDFE